MTETPGHAPTRLYLSMPGRMVSTVESPHRAAGQARHSCARVCQRFAHGVGPARRAGLDGQREPAAPRRSAAAAGPNINARWRTDPYFELVNKGRAGGIPSRRPKRNEFCAAAY